ncbi:MAG: triphosphoribosyl-dephospho-CoA synthase [Planctomycetota bacterium]|nr:MAG: triphosphoribosyl-dephospho-CoA synthase [Planctomycetota bacterium]
MKPDLTIGRLAELACSMEVLAPKPGNVYPGAEWNFTNTTVADFLKSAKAISFVFDRAKGLTVGELVLNSVRATQLQVTTNTNLGQVLLLAPLAKTLAESGELSESNLQVILDRLTIDDSVKVYEAIRLAKPGGLGQKSDQDIQSRPTQPLLQIMQMVQAEDGIAEAYATGFWKIFHTGRSAIYQSIYAGKPWRDVIVDCHIELLSMGDTLIRRKAGADAERIVQQRARGVLNLKSNPNQYAAALRKLDRDLRVSGNRLNPGTTADLVTASLFLALSEGVLQIPLEMDLLCDKYNPRP